MSDKDLKNFSDAQLKEELKRREEGKAIPPIQTIIDWSNVLSMVEIELAILRSTGAHSKDFEHWLYEEVLKTVYGSNIFDWVNKVCE